VRKWSGGGPLRSVWPCEGVGAPAVGLVLSGATRGGGRNDPVCTGYCRLLASIRYNGKSDNSGSPKQQGTARGGLEGAVMGGVVRGEGLRRGRVGGGGRVVRGRAGRVVANSAVCGGMGQGSYVNGGAR